MTRYRKYFLISRRCSLMCIFLIGSICFLGIYLFFVPKTFNYFAVLAKIKVKENIDLSLIERSTFPAKEYDKPETAKKPISFKSNVSSFKQFLLNRKVGELTVNAAPFASELDYIPSFRFVINERDICNEITPFLILLIATKADEKQHREAIRKTWGNESVVPGIKVVRLFMLGVNSKEQNEALLRESSQYHDIIQQDFLDTYKNLTLKTIMGLKWVAAYCGGANFVMKTDSDVFVNTEYLIQRLLRPLMPPPQYYFTGYLVRNGQPHRSNESKWYVPKEIYSAERYPDFCSGTGYVLSGALASKIVNASLKVKYIYLEDIYVALCLEHEGIDIVPPPENYLFNSYKVPFSPCTYNRLITSHGIYPDEQITYWETLQSNKYVCGK
uniref:Hexosyltransferase n=1 Tax=Chrysemys picta bellii TaxID=8478 RepID=A0A8C3IYN0_CHRPI|nr:beta-1,3-galactosyltransferase 2-like isoform X1 [Chrysemys picta bellii]XP_023957789.1 beta-1,3-galactosyltransferase 2-like isoform X1 [Chrysemys picta bellii]XP_042696623.1 beta-1,3-galactosyltransferase 2-like isoform X1 [Chrysemys picta bellii]XP_042696624.1 beta-1,3-galactosyltransferase 2-like isoform X1 [Chrysemys picta bellii]XP_042696625.1 beta-1,3-galactosyltransferase 2-like isoform X1 [Chrysemys picta bellii]XP_042696626.1 beta-1,3-galactosyltransferase 2-like isoform X1 [Chrys